MGDYARDEVLAELVAFANADGGTLVLGVHETRETPRRAERLEPLPNCEGLAQRLLDAAEDVIEPRIQGVSVRAIPANDTGAGYVLMRVGKSLSGPHRLASTREFYVRRGERASRMDVREIKDVTLELARTGDRVATILEERHEAARSQFAKLEKADIGHELSPLVIRATAAPTTPQEIENLTSRRDLWWRGGGFEMFVGTDPYRCDYPAREFDRSPNIRLRALESENDPTDGGPYRLLRADGLVEFTLIHPKQDTSRPGERVQNRIYVAWVVGLVAGVLAQLEHLRARVAWDAVTFGLEIEIWSEGSLDLRWDDRSLSSRKTLPQAAPLRMPRYQVGEPAEFNNLLRLVIKDLMNAWGRNWEDVCTVPWPTVLASKG